MSVAALMRRIVYEAAAVKAKVQGNPKDRRGWSFNKKIQLLVNPEIRCPYCEKWFPTGKVWLVDEARGYLLKAWDSKTGEKLFIGTEHPHVFYNGEICTGDAKSAVAALTIGVCYDDYANSGCTPGFFMRSLGDKCEEAMKEKCQDCGDGFDISYMNEVKKGCWYCESCRPEPEEEPIYICVNCGNEVDSDGSYCGDCCCEDCVEAERAADREEDEAREEADK